jgi:hypothetical protein
MKSDGDPGGRKEMKKNGFIGLGLMLLVLPGLAWADCVDVTRVTDHYVQGAHDIILYNRVTPVAYLNVPWCNISPRSSIQLTSGYLCDGDKIIVDGEGCPIFSLSTSSTIP